MSRVSAKYETKGRAAYIAGVELDACPYVGIQRTWWREGWTAAREADPLLDENERHGYDP